MTVVSTGKSHLTDFFLQTIQIWNENCLWPGSESQPGDIGIKDTEVDWVMGFGER